MEKIFITGATGLIGKYLLREMIERDEISIIYALYRTQIPFTNKKILWVRGDMDHLPSFTQAEGITKVIHCAALMDRGVRPNTLYQNNVRWTKQILNLCKKCDVKEFLLFSSVNVKLCHCGMYAKSKQKSEDLARRSGIPYKIIRPSLVFGGGVNGISNLMKYMKRLPVMPVFGNGHAKEQPIHVEDLAKLSVNYLLDPEDEELLEVYGRESMEYDIMLKQIATVIGQNIFILHLPFKPFFYVALLLEHMNLPLPITAEQMAHIYEDLEANMEKIYKRYVVYPKRFLTYPQQSH